MNLSCLTRASLVQARLSLLSQRSLFIEANRGLGDNVYNVELTAKQNEPLSGIDHNLYHVTPLISLTLREDLNHVVTRTKSRWRLVSLNSNRCSGLTVDSRLLFNTTNFSQALNPHHNVHKTSGVFWNNQRFNIISTNRFLNSDQLSLRSRYLYKHHHRQHRDDRRTTNRSTTSMKQYLSLIGLVGLFKDKTADNDEDKALLTDSEKMKKMKPVELLIAKGVLSMCDQNYASANEFFHKALHIAQDEEDEERENQILNLLAANYFESGDFENAEKLFIDLMKRMIADGVEATAPPILELSLKLASIYSRNPLAHQKALKGFRFVINSLLENLEDILSQEGDLNVDDLTEERRDELALLGWSYDWFAKHLLAANDYNGAADMLQRALKISSQVLGPLHDQTLILLNDVGTTLAMNGSPEEGRRFIRKAVECAIKSQSKELASFYVNLGLVNLKLLKLEEAKRYCEFSLELASKNREHYNSHEVIELSQSCLNEVERLLEVGDK